MKIDFKSIPPWKPVDGSDAGGGTLLKLPMQVLSDGNEARISTPVGSLLSSWAWGHVVSSHLGIWRRIEVSESSEGIQREFTRYIKRRTGVVASEQGRQKKKKQQLFLSPQRMEFLPIRPSVTWLFPRCVYTSEKQQDSYVVWEVKGDFRGRERFPSSLWPHPGLPF